MPKRLSSNAPRDINEAAYEMVRRSTQADSDPPSRASSSEISRVMAAMGRKGGKIGGKRRMTTMTAEQRRDVALTAAKARWSRKKK